MSSAGISDIWQAKITAIEASDPEDSVDEVDDYEVAKAKATAEVPTAKSTKEQIRDYLIYEHGIDPEDLQDQTKDELLSLVTDLE